MAAECKKGPCTLHIRCNAFLAKKNGSRCAWRVCVRACMHLCVCIRCVSVQCTILRWRTSSFNTFSCQEKIACHMPQPNYDATSNLSLWSGKIYINLSQKQMRSHFSDTNCLLNVVGGWSGLVKFCFGHCCFHGVRMYSAGSYFRTEQLNCLVFQMNGMSNL